MSKEMKMADYFDLPLSMLCRDAYGNELNFEDMSISELQAAAHAINNHDRLVDEVAALRETLVECMDALEMSYDVNEYPANGKTIQDAAAAKASKLLTELGGGDD